MAYTEIKKINEKNYFYRVRTIRQKKRFLKDRIYLGKNLQKEELGKKEAEADIKLNSKHIKRKLLGIMQKIKAILKKNNIKKAGIFGSYTKGEENKNSDIDILIEPAKGMGFKFAGLEIQLSKVLKKKVDLVSYNGISPYLKKRILSQEVRII